MFDHIREQTYKLSFLGYSRFITFLYLYSLCLSYHERVCVCLCMSYTIYMQYIYCIRSNVVHAHVVTKVTVNIKQDYSFSIYIYIGRDICRHEWSSFRIGKFSESYIPFPILNIMSKSI